MFDFEIIGVNFLTCYDNEGGDDTGGEAGDDGSSNSGTENKGTTPPGGAPKVFDEAAVNKIVEDRLKRERQKSQKEREGMVKELETLKKGAGLTEAEKESLTKQIEDLKTQGMTAEQKAKVAKEKAEKEWKEKHESLSSERDKWKAEYERYRKANEVTQAAAEAGANPQSLKFLEALLSPKTRLVEDQDEDGKPKGTYTARVRMGGKDKDGKPVDLDFTVSEAVKYMKDSPDEFGVLFLTDAQSGLGGNNGTAGRKPVVNEKLSMADYMKMREKDPRALNLVKD